MTRYSTMANGNFWFIIRTIDDGLTWQPIGQAFGTDDKATAATAADIAQALNEHQAVTNLRHDLENRP